VGGGGSRAASLGMRFGVNGQVHEQPLYNHHVTVRIMLVSAAAARPSHQLHAERCQAEEKSLVLLQSWLTADQHAQWERERQFEVTSSHTGGQHRITNAISTNVLQLDRSGQVVAKWCFSPAGSLARGDVLLAQKVALETMEFQALAVANKYRAPSAPDRVLRIQHE
jgi:hypothetical protein